MMDVFSEAPAKPDLRAGTPSSPVVATLAELRTITAENIPHLKDPAIFHALQSLELHLSELTFKLNKNPASPDDDDKTKKMKSELLATTGELFSLLCALTAETKARETSPPPPPPMTSPNDVASTSAHARQDAQAPTNSKVTISAPKRAAPSKTVPAKIRGVENDDGFKPVPRHLQFKAKRMSESRVGAIETPSTAAAAGIDVDPDDVQARMDTGPAPAPKTRRPPPIKIVPDSNWQVHIAMIRQKIAPSTYCKMKGRYIHISVQEIDEYRDLLTYLQQHKIQNWTYLLDEDKPFKVVIRGLPAQTSADLIKRHIELEGFTDVKVNQMFKGPKIRRTAMPLFYVQVLKTPDVLNIYDITEIFGMEVQVEKYRGLKGPSQCHRCQNFGHSSNACRLNPRCVKCGGPHLTSSDECVKAAEEPCLCCNCGGAHPANYRKCPRFPKKKGQNGNQQDNFPPPPNSRQTVMVVPSGRFSANEAKPAFSYASAVTGTSDQPKQAPTTSSTPNNEECSVSDLLKELLVLEANYSRTIILQAFKNALPAIKAASHPVDRVYYLYESLTALSP